MFGRILIALNAFLLYGNVQEIVTGTADGWDYLIATFQVLVVLFFVLFKDD